MASSSSYALLYLGEASIHRTAFDQRAHRAGGAFGTAIAAHAIILFSVLGLARVDPAVTSLPTAPASAIARFIFTDRLGDGSGRSGGGDHSADPASLVRTRGTDVRAIPVAPPLSLVTPDTIAPEREPAPSLPVMPMNAGDLPQVGAVDGVPGPPTDARGPGDSGTGTRTGSGRGLGEGPGDGIGDGPYGVGNGVTAPDLIHRTSPQYTAEAMRAKLQGVAVLTGIVGVDGRLHDIRVARSLDAAFGLDQEAIACVRQWRFRPGTRQSKPVAVYVTIEVAFNLR
jgi:periplasmic protein TonB